MGNSSPPVEGPPVERSGRAGSMESHLVFPTHVYSTRIADWEWAPALIQDIADWRRAATDSIGRSTSGETGWHSPIDACRRPAFAPLLRAVIDATTAVFRAERYLDNSRVRVEAMWANVLGPGAYNVVHSHVPALWAGVYHLVVPAGSPGIVFLDPRGAVPKGRFAPGAEREDRTTFEAVPGQVLIFPGWLQHYIEPHRGDGERISIGFNVRQIIKPRID